MKNRKEGRKNEQERERERERDRERERKKEKGKEGGGPKKAKEKQRETQITKHKLPFVGAKTGFFYLKKRKESNKKLKQKNINKGEGLGPSEVALWATSPDP